jgi:hypothetical protein
VPSRWQLADGLTKPGLEKVFGSFLRSAATRLHEESLAALKRAARDESAEVDLCNQPLLRRCRGKRCVVLLIKQWDTPPFLCFAFPLGCRRRPSRRRQLSSLCSGSPLRVPLLLARSWGRQSAAGFRAACHCSQQVGRQLRQLCRRAVPP